MSGRVTISTRRGNGEFFPRVKARLGRTTGDWTLETSFTSQTDALDAGYAWACRARWTLPVNIVPPYTRAAWAGTWDAVAEVSP